MNNFIKVQQELVEILISLLHLCHSTKVLYF